MGCSTKGRMFQNDNELVRMTKEIIYDKENVNAVPAIDTIIASEACCKRSLPIVRILASRLLFENINVEKGQSRVAFRVGLQLLLSP